jgi:CheY-like chemotaxis protein
MPNSNWNSVAGPGEPRASRSLLIVEDDKDSCEMLLLIMRKLFPELSTLCAANGKIGWELFQLHTPEIVVTDLSMPEMDGLQMARMIRSHKPQTWLIALSADLERATLEGPDAKGRQVFNCFIVKPFQFNTLSKAIEAVLRNQNCREEASGYIQTDGSL